jgi:tRNA nucleotidyltransferase/poly(A) polymerase
MSLFTFYEVGGKVRDEILGLTSKDVDYTVVPSEDLLKDIGSPHTMFIILEGFLKEEGFEIFLVTPDCFTIRAKFPKDHIHSGLVADFVMARKETGYIMGTRTPIVLPGTLEDDLTRRDFTVNAMARDIDGNIIDLFGGMEDLKNMVLKTPLHTKETFDDDPLRIIRAIRFSITKGFSLKHLDYYINNYDYESKMSVVSAERIREELYKCFKHDTMRTLDILDQYPTLKRYIFENKLMWLKPTMEQ